MTNTDQAMYTLGQLARAVHPDGDIPAPILDALLTRPASGLGMLVKSGAASKMLNADGKHGDYDKLVAALPADLTNGPVPVADQGPFWTGWYHYLSGLDHAAKWGPEQLSRAGALLFGDRWQTDLARALGVNDRRVREWVAGSRKPSAGVWADIAALLRQRQSEGLALLSELDRNVPSEGSAMYYVIRWADRSSPVVFSADEMAVMAERYDFDAAEAEAGEVELIDNDTGMVVGWVMEN